MFVFLSTMFNFLISPFFLLALSCLLPFFVFLNPKKKWVRVLIVGAPFLVMLVITSPLGPVLAHMIEGKNQSLNRAQFVQAVKEDASRPVALVVLSGGVAHYKKDSERFKFFSNFARFATPFIWGKIYPNVHYIFSFGLVDGVGAEYLNEGQAMEKFAQEFGLDQSRIHVTRASHNSFDEALAVKDVLQSLHPRLTYVATSALHLPRVMKVYSKLEIPAQPFPAFYYTFPFDDGQLSFSMSNAELLRQSLHELIGNVVYKLTGKM